jgi:hypothetical protein
VTAASKPKARGSSGQTVERHADQVGPEALHLADRVVVAPRPAHGRQVQAAHLVALAQEAGGHVLLAEVGTPQPLREVRDDEENARHS